MIDWTKPIETVPCDRNPVPVPCLLLGGPDADGEYAILFERPWRDPEEPFTVEVGHKAYCYADGELTIYNGYVRNVVALETGPVAQEEVETLTASGCVLTDPTGTVTHHVVETLTVRDQFAIAALPAVMAELYAADRMGNWSEDNDLTTMAAGLSYDYADAMMKERTKNS